MIWPFSDKSGSAGIKTLCRIAFASASGRSIKALTRVEILVILKVLWFFACAVATLTSIQGFDLVWNKQEKKRVRTQRKIGRELRWLDHFRGLISIGFRVVFFGFKGLLEHKPT